MTNHIRAHNTDADDKRRAADKAANAKQRNAAPGQSTNTPERTSGQEHPMSNTGSSNTAGSKPDLTKK